MPLFSVVIPTRNHAALLRYALQGALEQDFDDYEVIVSDNASSDDTRQVVADLSGNRVRYVNTGKHLSFADSWDFAVRHARGKYIMMLGDDDCMTPILLGVLSPLAQSAKTNLISYVEGRYYHPDYDNPGLRNQLRIEEYTGQLLEIEALPTLRKAHNFDAHSLPLPSALISGQIVNTIIARLGRLFFNPAPDYCAFAMVLSFGGNFFLMDRPLLAFGRSSKSSGPTAFKLAASSPKKRSRYVDISEEPFELAPLKGHNAHNIFSEGLLKAGRNLPEQFSSFELSWVEYYARYYFQMQDSKMNGLDIEDDELEFTEVVSRLPDDLRRKVEGTINRRKEMSFSRQQWHRLRRIASSTIRRSSLLIRLTEPILGPGIRVNSKWPVILQGDEAGFSNILECARKLDAICSNIKPDKEA